MLSNINSAITVLLRTVMWMQIDNISLYCLLAYILNQSKITVVSYMMWLSFSHMDIQTQNRKQYGCSFIASLLNSFPRACATPCHTKLGIVITMETTTQTKTRQTVTLNIDAKKLMPDLLWALKARSTDANRYTLNYINIDENGIIATDGRRLHIAGLYANKKFLPNGLEYGLYQVNVCKDIIVFIPQEGTFPD